MEFDSNKEIKTANLGKNKWNNQEKQGIWEKIKNGIWQVADEVLDKRKLVSNPGWLTLFYH